MAPLPIALVMTSFDPGGTERQMTELMRRLDPGRWAVHVACFRRRGAWYPRVAERAASVAEFQVTSFRRRSALTELGAFARWCRSVAVQVVHTTELYSNIFALPGAALARVPVRVANRREINPDKSIAQIALQRAAYACAHKVVANSRAAAQRLRLERVPARKIAVIPNGLDVHPRIVPTASARLRRVVVVANLRPEKGHDVLLAAAPEILRRFPDAHFELVGGGPERDKLAAAVAARGLGGAFTLVGHCENVGERLAANHIFVLPSRSEAFPNAVLEAMGVGLPVVASAVGGILELVEDGRTGLLVPPNDPLALAERVCRLMGDGELAAALGCAARVEVERQYSFDRMVSAFESLYLGELARRGIVSARQPQLATS